MSSSNRYWDNYYQQRDRNDNIKTKLDIKEVRSGKVSLIKTIKETSLKDKIDNLFKDRL